MRILAISHLFPYAENTHYGIFAARQFAALKQLGADVTVFFPILKIPRILGYYREKWKNYNLKHAPIAYEDLNVIQVPYIRLTRGAWSCRWEGLSLYYAMKKKVLELHNNKPFDIIYGRGLFPCAGAAIYLSKMLEIPAVGVAIGGDINLVPNYSTALLKHTRWLIQNLDGVLANGAGISQKIKELTGRECTMAHGVVDLDTFQPAEDKNRIRCELKLPSESLVLLFIGSLKKQKGVFELLEAFSKVRLNLPNIVLKICGQGVERFNLENKIAELNLKEAVHLVGSVEPADIHKWMQASDVFVLPSYTEGMPNVVMEAMAAGCPVVATTVGGLPDAVGDCDGVILVEPGNINLLAGAIQKVLKDEKLRRIMQQKVRETAGKRFGAKENCQKILDYLAETIKRY